MVCVGLKERHFCVFCNVFLGKDRCLCHHPQDSAGNGFSLFHCWAWMFFLSNILNGNQLKCRNAHVKITEAAAPAAPLSAVYIHRFCRNASDMYVGIYEKFCKTILEYKKENNELTKLPWLDYLLSNSKIKFLTDKIELEVQISSCIPLSHFTKHYYCENSSP